MCVSSMTAVEAVYRYDLQKERGKAKETLKSKKAANGLQKNLDTYLQMDDVCNVGAIRVQGSD